MLPGYHDELTTGSRGTVAAGPTARVCVHVHVCGGAHRVQHTQHQEAKIAWHEQTRPETGSNPVKRRYTSTIKLPSAPEPIQDGRSKAERLTGGLRPVGPNLNRKVIAGTHPRRSRARHDTLCLCDTAPACVEMEEAVAGSDEKERVMATAQATQTHMLRTYS